VPGGEYELGLRGAPSSVPRRTSCPPLASVLAGLDATCPSHQEGTGWQPIQLGVLIQVLLHRLLVTCIHIHSGMNHLARLWRASQ